jgi:hypothetical protein
MGNPQRRRTKAMGTRTNKKLECLTIQMTVVIKGDRATLFNGNGVRITTIDAALIAAQPDPQFVLWNEWAREQAVKGGGNEARKANRSPWERKIEAMRQAWKCRAVGVRTGRRPRRRNGSEDKTWGEAASRMMKMMSMRRDEHRKRKDNRWWTWSTTVSRNHNRKAHDRREYE